MRLSDHYNAAVDGLMTGEARVERRLWHSAAQQALGLTTGQADADEEHWGTRPFAGFWCTRSADDLTELLRATSTAPVGRPHTRKADI